MGFICGLFIDAVSKAKFMYHQHMKSEDRYQW